MEDKENPIPRLTRSQAKKRAATTTAAMAPSKTKMKKKRVPLAEIPNFTRSPVFTRSRINKTKKIHDPQPSDRIHNTDIYSHLRLIEEKRRPKPDYLETVQRNVTPEMRAILVDWLVEVSEEYSLFSDTLYLTVSYVDRFLSANAVSKMRLQLLGVASMLIASKYEEISPPRIKEFCYLTENSYNKKEVLKMESEVLECLNYEITGPTINTFLRMFIGAGLENDQSTDLKLEFHANYLAELSLLDYDCVRFLPSVVAASAIFIARLTINTDNQPWNASLKQRTGYELSELMECVKAIHDLQLNKKNSSLSSIRDKYRQHKFKCVADLVPPLEIPMPNFEGFKKSHDILIF